MEGEGYRECIGILTEREYQGLIIKKEAPNPVKRHRQLMPIIEWVLPMTIYHKKVVLSTPILCGNKKRD